MDGWSCSRLSDDVTAQVPGRESYLSRRTVIWLIPILLTIHNAEEAVAFSRMRLPAVLPAPFATFESQLTNVALYQALATLSALAFVLAAFVVIRPNARLALWL